MIYQYVNEKPNKLHQKLLERSRYLENNSAAIDSIKNRMHETTVELDEEIVSDMADAEESMSPPSDEELVSDTADAEDAMSPPSDEELASVDVEVSPASSSR